MDYNDELCWAGAWLYKATNESKYLTQAETYYVPGASWGQSWDDKTAGSQVLTKTINMIIILFFIS